MAKDEKHPATATTTPPINMTTEEKHQVEGSYGECAAVVYILNMTTDEKHRVEGSYGEYAARVYIFNILHQLIQLLICHYLEVLHIIQQQKGQCKTNDNPHSHAHYSRTDLNARHHHPKGLDDDDTHHEGQCTDDTYSPLFRSLHVNVSQLPKKVTVAMTNDCIGDNNGVIRACVARHRCTVMRKDEHNNIHSLNTSRKHKQDKKKENGGFNFVPLSKLLYNNVGYKTEEELLNDILENIKFRKFDRDVADDREGHNSSALGDHVRYEEKKTDMLCVGVEKTNVPQQPQELVVLPSLFIEQPKEESVTVLETTPKIEMGLPEAIKQAIPEVTMPVYDTPPVSPVNQTKLDTQDLPLNQLIQQEVPLSPPSEPSIPPDTFLTLFPQQSEFVSRVRSCLVADSHSSSITLCEEGVGGTYFVHENGQKIAVFKPTDEEPGSPANPKKNLAKPILLPGGGSIREVAAYLLDRGWAGVPETCFIKDVKHLAMNGDYPKCGSLQKFIQNVGDSSSVGTNKFSTSDVHRIGLLDLRLLNLDRNEENLLLQPHSDGQRLRLIPIDHTYSLPPHINHSPYFVWHFWRQAKEPFSEDIKKYVADIDVSRDSHLLRYIGLEEGAVRVNEMMSVFVKMAVAEGLTLFDMAEILRKKKPNIPSEFQEFVGGIGGEMNSDDFIHRFEEEVKKFIVMKKEAKLKETETRKGRR